MLQNNRSKNKILQYYLVLSCILISFCKVMPVCAVQQTGTLVINASVVGACSVNGATLNFPAYSGFADVTANTNFTVTCTNGVSYSINMDAGQNAGGSLNTNSRKLKHSTQSVYLNYQLYKDSSNTNVWGAQVNNDGLNSQTGNGSAQSITVYGKISAGQSVATGNYSDSVSIIVNF